MSGYARLVAAVSSSAVLLLAMLLPGTSSAGGNTPVPVTFGPNIDLNVNNVPQRETTVAVNPKDPKNIVVGNIDRFSSRNTNSFSFTTDGGQTWTLGGLVPLENNSDMAQDPALAADTDGNFYYSYLDIKQHRTDVVAAKSMDGGRSFSTLSVVHQSDPSLEVPDKDYIGADTWPGSPFLNNLYVAWTSIELVGYRIMVAVSRDRGITWSNPIAVSPATSSNNEALEGALPVVAPDGTVYIFYADIVFVTGPTSIRFSRSADGGRTWSQPAAVASSLPSPGFFRLKNDDPGWDTTYPLGILSSTLPTAAIAPGGGLFVAWVDFSNGSCANDGSISPPCTNADVRLAFSKNRGKTWSAPVKVSDETNATDQFFPWIAIHPDGLLSLIWTDKRLDPNNINYDVFYTNTFDGSTFLPNVRVRTTTALSGNLQTRIGDYNGMAVSADGIFPAWTHMVSGTPDIFTAVGHFVK